MVVFAIIIGVTVVTINITLSEAIKTTADGSANSIASQMQTVINNVDAIAGDMETYLTKYFDMKKMNYADMSGTRFVQPGDEMPNSIIYNKPIKKLISDAEKYMTERAYNTVKNDPVIVSFGILLAPYAMDKDMLEFAFYVDPTKDGKDIYLHKYGVGVSEDCAAYAEADWYGWAKELKATFYKRK